MQQNTRWL